jgi:hypothetical protein
LTLVVAAFLGGIGFERERLERERRRLEFEAQAREVDRLMARFNALMNGGQKRDAQVLPGVDDPIKAYFREKMVRPALETTESESAPSSPVVPGP